MNTLVAPIIVGIAFGFTVAFGTAILLGKHKVAKLPIGSVISPALFFAMNGGDVILIFVAGFFGLIGWFMYCMWFG